MDHFQLRDGELYAEDVPLARIAEEVGTPVYVYSRATLERHARVFREALDAVPRKHIATSPCCACSGARVTAPTSFPAAR